MKSAIAASNQFESFTKFFLVLAAMSYSVGIVVVNLFYAKYGYHSLSLFRLNYAVAGLWCIFFLALSYFLWEMFFENVATVFRSKSETIDRIFAALGIFVGPLIIGLIAKGIAYLVGIKGSWEWLVISFIGYFALSGTGEALIELATDRMHGKVRLGSAVGPFFALLIFVAYLGGFSRTLYSFIPASVGGGRPQKAQLVVGHNQEDWFKHFGVAFVVQAAEERKNKSVDEVVSITDTLRILTSSENDLVIFSVKDSLQSIVLRRESIFAIRYIADKTDE